MQGAKLHASDEAKPVALPDCAGEWPAEWVAQEDALRALVNATRAQGGSCSAVAFEPAEACAEDADLTRISRCFAREQALAGSAALAGGAADEALRDRVLATNYEGELTGHDGDIVDATPADAVAGFLSTPGQCEAIFNPATDICARRSATVPTDRRAAPQNCMKNLAIAPAAKLGMACGSPGRTHQTTG